MDIRTDNGFYRRETNNLGQVARFYCGDSSTEWIPLTGENDQRDIEREICRAVIPPTRLRDVIRGLPKLTDRLSIHQVVCERFRGLRKEKLSHDERGYLAVLSAVITHNPDIANWDIDSIYNKLS